MTKLIAIYTTTGSLDEARTIALAVVERALAACVQITEIESFYRWQGAVQNDTEWRIFIKTTADRYDAVDQAIRELHSYELPAIHSVALDRSYAPYAAWVGENSCGPRS